MKEETSVDVLSRKLQQGLATKEERGVVLKTINTQLAVDLVSSMDGVRDSIERLKKLKNKVTNKFIEKAELALECDDMSIDDLQTMLNNIMDNEMKVVDLYRKVLQGNRMLFEEDSLSEEDKIILRVLRSFATNDEKKDFIGFVSDYMNKKVNSNVKISSIDNENLEDANIIE